MELARIASLDPFLCVLQRGRPIKTLPEGFTDQGARGGMRPTLTLMGVGDELDALFPRDTLQEHPVGSASIEGPFYEHVPLRDARKLLSFGAILGKSIIVEVRPDVSHPGDVTRGSGSTLSGPEARGLSGLGAEVVAPGSFGGPNCADGRASLSSKIPGGSGARADAMCDNSSAIALSRRGTCRSSSPSKWRSIRRTSRTYASICGSVHWYSLEI